MANEATARLRAAQEQLETELRALEEAVSRTRSKLEELERWLADGGVRDRR